MTDFFETRVKKFGTKGEKEKTSAVAKKSLKKTKKRKKEDTNSSVVESSEESTEARHLSKKYCILQLQGFTCVDQQAQAQAKEKEKEKENFQDLQKEQQGAKSSD